MPEKLTARNFEPEEEWWKRDTPAKINRAIGKLRAAGVGDEIIYEVIELLIDAMRGEYGE